VKIHYQLVPGKFGETPYADPLVVRGWGRKDPGAAAVSATI